MKLIKKTVIMTMLIIIIIIKDRIILYNICIPLYLVKERELHLQIHLNMIGIIKTVLELVSL